MKLLKIFFGQKKSKFDKNMEKFMTIAPQIIKMINKANESTKQQFRFEDDIDTHGKNLHQNLYNWLLGYRNHQLQASPYIDMDMDKATIPITLIDEDDIINNRIKVKPRDVVNELERVPNPIDCKNIDEKIELFRDKKYLANQRYVEEEIEAFIERLNNRKSYYDLRNENDDFFNQFPYTTDEKISDLLEKYELKNAPVDLFIPSLPKEAISIMKKYSNKTFEITGTGKKPVFYIIAQPDDFENLDKRLDPILLVQSPFGFVWQILGAWDKEMLLLSEL